MLSLFKLMEGCLLLIENVSGKEILDSLNLFSENIIDASVVIAKHILITHS